MSQQLTHERPRRSATRIIVGVAATAAGVVLSAICLGMANFMTYGLYSWQEPTVDGAIVIPLVGIAVTLPLGPVALSVGDHRRRWLCVAGAVSVLGVLGASLVTWIPVSLTGG